MGKDDDSSYRAEIPDDALAEALQSIEKIERGKDDAPDAPADPSAQGAEDEVEAVVKVEIEDMDAAGGPELDQIRADLDKARREAAETHEKMLRVAADADNIRKRALKERDEAIRFGQEGLLRDLLPVADNLERTLEHVPPKGEDPALDALRQGVEMVLRQYLTILESHGVKPIESLGQPFDPKIHEALSQEPTDEAAAGTVLREMHRGYNLADRLLRPALVTVACEVEAGTGEGAPGCKESDLQAVAPQAADADGQDRPDTNSDDAPGESDTGSTE